MSLFLPSSHSLASHSGLTSLEQGSGPGSPTHKQTPSSVNLHISAIVNGLPSSHSFGSHWGLTISEQGSGSGSPAHMGNEQDTPILWEASHCIPQKQLKASYHSNKTDEFPLFQKPSLALFCSNLDFRHSRVSVFSSRIKYASELSSQKWPSGQCGNR